jgi:hypothetical protein
MRRGDLIGQHVHCHRYLIAFGTEVDLHTAHWHGLTVLSDGHRMDVIELLPATFRTVEMVWYWAGWRLCTS